MTRVALGSPALPSTARRLVSGEQNAVVVER